jgi:hypothetical protein
MFTFATPLGALAALTAIVPLAALAWGARRSDRATRILKLGPAPRSSLVLPALLAAGACVCVGLAAAQPALRTVQHRTVRSQSEVLYVVDVSRSMAAAKSQSGTTRLARARDVVRRIHDAVDDVPSGLAGLTDRVLPYAFATADDAMFDETLRRSVAIEAPPPEQVSRNATSFAALAQIIPDGFFDPTAKRRTCVVVSDAETRPYSTAEVASALGGDRGCRLVVVRVGGTDEHVYGADGVPEPAYAPDPAAGSNARALAQATGGRSFDSADMGGAVSAVRSAAETGPTMGATQRTTTRPLAPWLALAALVLTLAFAILRVGRIPLRGVTTPEYNRLVGRKTVAS